MPNRMIGLTGNITLPTGFSAALFRGSANRGSKWVETTNATTSNGDEEGLGGVRNCSGTAMGYPQNSGSGIAPGAGSIPSGNSPQTPGPMTLTFAAGNTWAFSAIISNIKYDWDYKGNQIVTFSYRSSGGFVETWGVNTPLGKEKFHGYRIIR